MYSCSSSAPRPLISGFSKGWSRHRCNISQSARNAPETGLIHGSPQRCFSGETGSKMLEISSAKTLVKILSNGCGSKQLGSSCFSRIRRLSTGDFTGFVACDGRGTRKSRREIGERSFSSSWEASADSYFSKSSEVAATDVWRNREGKTSIRDSPRSRSPAEGRRFEKQSTEEEDPEPIDDSRWNRIRSKYDRMIERESRYERPEVARWNRQENWGRNTWKQATESSLPKIVGESVYGVNPILAALTAGRREFYALYLQDGMDLSEKNKKKKDKKSIKKILKIADEIGLTVKEASKHDLNMISDNRPHQGLILDASPLETVGIRELDRVSIKGDRAPVWIALDEIMDPQNLGAIIRSAYFFGVEGVILCAKNSAPLSGVVSKASAGSLEMIELRSCKNMMQFLASSAENGWRVLGGSVSSRALPLGEVGGGIPTVLVLGSEGTGLRPLVERSCTDLVRIPGVPHMDGDDDDHDDVDDGDVDGDAGKVYTGDLRPFMAVESLNVSVAAGVLLYHLAGNTGMKAQGS